MRPLLWLWLLFVLGPLTALSQDGSSQVNQAEILRLGNVQQRIGEPAVGSVQDFMEVMGPPESDADKWFISVLSTQRCGACERLRQDWTTDPWLLALGHPTDPSKSWSHFNVYYREDASQSFRFEQIQITSYPTILVQPPRSGRYGDPSTVVFQGTYDGDPQRLARAITGAIRAYVARVSEQPSPSPATIDVPPPWSPAPSVDPWTPQTPRPFPLFDPTIPPQPAPAQPAPVPSFPWGAVMSLMFAGFSVPTAIAIVVWLVSWIRAQRQAAGKPLILDQNTFDELMKLLRQLSDSQSRASTK